MTAQTNNPSGINELLAVDPFRSLNVHFGMLLGVDDFRTQEAYHRGKMWLHSAWLHRQGTVWGLGVSVHEGAGEVRVDPGLAVDTLGRELYLDTLACLNLPAWFEQHKDDPELAGILRHEGDEVIFDAHVAMRFKACLTRQVPALSEPCDGSQVSTAYSRIAEQVELVLLPGLAPQWRTPSGSLPFHRVRLLFALEAPLEEDGEVIDDDQEVLDARAEVLALPQAEQPAAYLKWMRIFSAKDEMSLRPAEKETDQGSPLLPGRDPAWVPLADIAGIRLIPSEGGPGEGGWRLDDGALTVDNTVRPVHLPSSTIQELVCGPLWAAPVAPPAEEGSGEGVAAGAGEAAGETPEAALASDAGGPRVDPESVGIAGEQISFNVAGGPLLKASVDARGLEVSSFDLRDGWIREEIKSVEYERDEARVLINLRDNPGGRLVRLIVKGTGPFPLLGRNRIPLAGGVGGAPGSLYDGNDFITMFKAES